MRVNINATIPMEQMQKVLVLKTKFGCKKSEIAEKAMDIYLKTKFNANGSIKKNASL